MARRDKSADIAQQEQPVPAHVRNLIGRKFNHLTVVAYLGLYKKCSYWRCQCDCGKFHAAQARNLASGGTKSCGCIKGAKQVKDLVGQRFGRLLVLELDSRRYKGHGSAWLCQCDCGATKISAADTLSSGECRSCGCMKRGVAAVPAEQRFWGKIDKSGECWLWTAKAVTEFGYGVFNLCDDHGNVLAHRYSWELHNGTIPADMRVLHTCDNPPCVNPSHLFLGTLLDNVQDMMAKNRNGFVARRAESNVTAKLDWETIEEIRSEWNSTHCTIKSIAEMYSISPSHAGRIVRGESWEEEHRHTPTITQTLASGRIES